MRTVVHFRVWYLRDSLRSRSTQEPNRSNSRRPDRARRVAGNSMRRALARFFGINGFHATSMGDIVRAAGTFAGGIHRSFATKAAHHSTTVRVSMVKEPA